MFIFFIFAVVAAIGIIVYVLQSVAVCSYLSRQRLRQANDGSYTPSVSVLKPLKGIDDNLFDNLDSLCRQNYPEYEIIFSLQHQNDPAFKIAQKIKDKYPEKQISIIVEKYSVGLNPKVNNLIPAYMASKYEHVLISDSNVLLDKNYLSDITKHMADPEVGLVTNLIKGVGGRTIGSIFENLHLNSFVIGSVCFLDKFLGMPCVVGKSMLMSKKTLEAAGGLSSVKDVLAEDFVLGKKISALGKRIVVSGHLIKNVNEYWSFSRFLSRHTRWGKLRFRIGGAKYFSELLFNPVFAACASLAWEISVLTLSLVGIVSSLKIANDYYIGKKIRSGIKPLYYFLSPLKDIITGFIWFVPILSNKVVWRGNKYIIGKDSFLYPYNLGSQSLPFRLIGALKEKFA